MENYIRKIKELENEIVNESIVEKKGKYPILLTSVHSMEQLKEDGTIKLSEPFTKAIAKYVADVKDLYYLIKNFDDGIDPNHIEHDEFKNKLINIVKENDIKLVFDIHGASEKRDFDVELGTMNNLSADFSTIMELKEAFEENDLKVVLNEPFKGGMITQYLFMSSGVEVIQIEINKKYRDFNNLSENKKVTDSLIRFVEQYLDI